MELPGTKLGELMRLMHQGFEIERWHGVVHHSSPWTKKKWHSRHSNVGKRGESYRSRVGVELCWIMGI